MNQALGDAAVMRRAIGADAARLCALRADDIGRDLFISVNAEMFLHRQGHVDIAEAVLSRDAGKAYRLAYKQLAQLVDLLEADPRPPSTR
ncbi:MAG: hypothetical protein ACR2JM_13195 [Mycobacterium sp.]